MNACNSGRTHDGTKIIYKDSKRILRAVPRETACKGRPTAFTAFPKSGIEYKSEYNYYVEQKKEVDAYDVLMHSLLATRELNNTEATTMLLVFYLKHRDNMDIQKIRIAASALGILHIWLDVQSYIHNGTATGIIPFQPWDEFAERAKIYGINPSPYRKPSSIESMLRDLGDHLTRPIRIYLFGDENMKWKSLKTIAKRCEIMVETSDDLETVVDILRNDLGWVVKHFHKNSGDPYPFVTLKQSALPEIRIYAKSVMGDVFLTDSMTKMADYITFNKLVVGILRNEHVFILNAGAVPFVGVEDMAILVHGSPRQSGRYAHGDFDWNLVLDEMILQEKSGVYEEWPMLVFETMSHLEGKGVDVPILGQLKRYATDFRIMGMSRGGWCPLDGIVHSFVESYISDTYVRNRANALIKLGKLKKQHEGRRVIVCGEELFPYPKLSADKPSLWRYLLWRFRYRYPSTSEEFDKLVSNVVNRRYSTIGDLDGAVSRGVFNLPYNPPPSPAESVIKCLI